MDEPRLTKRVAAACRARSLTTDALAQQLGLNRIQLTLILAGRDPAPHGLVKLLVAFYCISASRDTPSPANPRQ